MARPDGSLLAPRERRAPSRPYREVRPRFTTGDLLCFRGRGPLGALIRILTRSPYSHVGAVYVFEGRVYCLEAVGAGVRLILMSELVRRYDGGIDYFEVLDVGEAHRRGAIGFGFQQLGKLYNHAGLVRFLVYIATGRKSRRRQGQVWFCSEIFVEAYRLQGVRLVDQRAAYTAPADLAESARVRFAFPVKRG
jgi:uncharacterized protein YycO